MLFGFLRRKPKYPETERRREPRFQAQDEFVLEFKASKSHYIGNGRDISANGVRFATTCKLKTQKDVILNFRFPPEFPGEKRLSVRATVVRVYKPQGAERYRVGCHLQHESEVTKETITQFIYWMENRSGK